MPESAYGNLGWTENREAAPLAPGLRRIPARTNSKLVPRLVLAVIVLYALTFAYLGARQHLSLQTNAGLGAVDQAVWNTLEGRPFAASITPEVESRLAVHVEPIILGIAQLYRLAPSPITLLAIQAVVVSLGALPVFWLARERLGHDLAGLVFAAAYLLTPSLGTANPADLNLVAMAGSFLLFAFWFAFRGHFFWFFAFCVLAMSTNELVPLTVAGIGLYVMLVRRNLWVGLATLALAGAWFITAMNVVMPAQTGVEAAQSLGLSGVSQPGLLRVVGEVVNDPAGFVSVVVASQNLEYFEALVQPVGYVALLGLPVFLIALPELFLGLSAGGSFGHLSPSQVNGAAIVAPFVILAAIYGAWYLVAPARKLSGGFGNLVLQVCLLVVFGASLWSYWGAVFRPLTEAIPLATSRGAAMADMVRRVPPEAAVSAGANVHPHLSQRPTIYVFPELAGAEYVLIDVLGDPAPLDVAGQRFRIDQMVNGTGEWGIVTGFDGLLLLKKGELNRTLPERLTSFARVEIARGRRIDVDFGDGLRLLSVETAPTESFRGRWPTVRLVAYWRAERLLDRGLLPTLFITDAAGRVVFADAHPAATAWLPPDEWTPGQIIRVEYAAAPLEDLELAFLKLGVSVRNERGEISGLLPAAIPPDMLPGRLSSDGTIVQVATLRRG